MTGLEKNAIYKSQSVDNTLQNTLYSVKPLNLEYRSMIVVVWLVPRKNDERAPGFVAYGYGWSFNYVRNFLKKHCAKSPGRCLSFQVSLSIFAEDFWQKCENALAK